MFIYDQETPTSINLNTICQNANHTVGTKQNDHNRRGEHRIAQLVGRQIRRAVNKSDRIFLTLTLV